MVREAHPSPPLMDCRTTKDGLQWMRPVLSSVITVNGVAVSENSVFPFGIPSSLEG